MAMGTRKKRERQERLSYRSDLPEPPGQPLRIDVAGTIIPNCTPIEATDQSRIFEIVWRYYVGYSVLNESYAAVYDAEQYEELGSGSIPTGTLRMVNGQRTRDPV